MQHVRSRLRKESVRTAYCLRLIHDQINFMKNVALLGAALARAAIPQPWPQSIGE